MNNSASSWIDLSHEVHPGISVYPGTKPPVLEYLYTVNNDGFTEMQLTLNSHAGTHIDAPAHMIAGGKTLDRFAPEQFTGAAVVVDCREAPGGEIVADLLMPYAEAIGHAEFVLLYTGWSHKWATGQYVEGHPALTEEAARWLASFPLKGIGVDTLSVDKMDSADYPVHKVILGKEMIIIENLTNLELLPATPFRFFGFPVKLREADATPVRAMAMIAVPPGAEAGG